MKELVYEQRWMHFTFRRPPVWEHKYIRGWYAIIMYTLPYIPEDPYLHVPKDLEGRVKTEKLIVFNSKREMDNYIRELVNRLKQRGFKCIKFQEDRYTFVECWRKRGANREYVDIYYGYTEGNEIHT